MMRSIATSLYCFCTLLLIGCGQSTSPGQDGDADALVGLELIGQRKFAEAIPHLERAIEKPLVVHTKSDVLTTIGNCYGELDQFEKSLEYHEKAINEDPTNHQAYVNRGIAYRLMGDYGKAAESYQKALTLAPDYAELHASMGALAIFQEDYETGIRHLERAIELDESVAVAHSNLALAYAFVGRFDEADEELSKAVIRGYHQPEVIRERIEELRDVSEHPE